MATKQTFLLKPSDFEFEEGRVVIKKSAVARRFRKLVKEAEKKVPVSDRKPIVKVAV